MRADAGPSTTSMLFQPANGFASDGDNMLDSDDSDDGLQGPALADRAAAPQPAPQVAGLFVSDSVLPDEHFGSLPVRDIFMMLENKVINLSPDYQRDVVWTADSVVGLIQSLFRNMHVPELLFNIYQPRDRNDPWYRRIPSAIQIRPEGRTALPDGWALKHEEDLDEDDEREDGEVMQVWNCADGKQRMSAIHKFMTGQVAIKGSDGKSVVYSGLDPDARALFDSKRLRYGFYRNLSNAQEREVFQRVQRGKVLTKGEILNSIDSPYSTWVRSLMAAYLGDSHDSLCPRMLSASRGTALIGAYQASRNIIVGVDDMSPDSDVRRVKALGQDAPPRQAEQDEVTTALDRFLALTKVAPLDGEDRWPDTPLYAPLRQHGVPVPHRVWRLRPDMVPARRDGKAKVKLGSDSIAFAPVELHVLPAIVHRYRHLADGDLLELVELVRVHVHDKLTGEVKANTKTYDLIKAWIKRSSNVAGFVGLATASGSGHAREPQHDEPAAAIPPQPQPRPAHEPPPPQHLAALPLSKKRSAGAASGSEDGAAGSGASTPSALKRVRTASGLGASAGFLESAGAVDGTAAGQSSSTSAARAAGADSSFQVSTRRDTNGGVPLSSSSFLPVGSSTSSSGRSDVAPAAASSSSASARPPAYAAPPRPVPPPPRPPVLPPVPAAAPAPAPAAASGLSEKQLKYIARVNPAAAAPPPPAVRSRQPPPPPPPAPAPAPAPSSAPSTQPGPRRSTILPWKRRPPPIQYDERGRPIHAAPATSAGASPPGPVAGSSSSFGSGATPRYGGPGPGAAGYEAENDVSLSFADDDEALGAHASRDYYGHDGAASASAVEQDEVQAAIFGSLRRAGGPAAPGPGSFAAADARASTAVGWRTVSGSCSASGAGGGGGSSGFLVKGDPEDEEARAAAALRAPAPRDERDDEIMGLVRARQRGESRAPPAEPSASSWRDREWGSVGARRRSPEPSRWDTDWVPRREERREGPREGWTAAVENGRERRTSGGYEAADRDGGWRRRDDYRDDDRAQSFRSEPRRRLHSRGYPPSPSPPPPAPPSSSSRLPSHLALPQHRQGSVHPPPLDRRSYLPHDTSRLDPTRTPAPPHDAAPPPRTGWDHGW
ncbi:hypothetical protein JCM3775_005726 [Rhodotorula graminis]